MKKAKKIMVITVLSITGIVLIGLLIFWINSPGKLEALKDEQGNIIRNSISEKLFIEVNGINQGMFIRSENPGNPVILFLHGGPGNPELPFIMPKESGERLEKYFTVCYWEQRGSGITYSSPVDSQTITVEQMVEDTHKVTEYLKSRFRQDKIFLMGHSWGSYLGVKTIEKYPEDYLAYMGIGQMSNQRESERLAYEYMLQHAEEISDKKAVIRLKKIEKNAPGFPDMDYLMSVRTELMEKYGIGTMHTNSSVSALVKNVLAFKGYTISEKMNYPKASLLSFKQLWPCVLKDNLFDSSTSFQIPVYILHGKYDYQVSYDLSKKYFDTLQAPEKEFFSFEKSAHSPNMEEPEKLVRIVRDITYSIKKSNTKQ